VKLFFSRYHPVSNKNKTENVTKSNNIFDPTAFFDDNSLENVDLDHLIAMLLIKIG
jgi:hypothetical protein